MKDLYIKGTPNSPEIKFHTDGQLEISGKSIPANAAKTFGPVIEWLENLDTDKVLFSCRFEYFNTSTSKIIYDILKMFESKYGKKKIVVKWYYEEGDEDVLDSGYYYQSLIDIPFEFYMMSELEMTSMY